MPLWVLADPVFDASSLTHWRQARWISAGRVSWEHGSPRQPVHLQILFPTLSMCLDGVVERDCSPGAGNKPFDRVRSHCRPLPGCDMLPRIPVLKELSLLRSFFSFSCTLRIDFPAARSESMTSQRFQYRMEATCLNN